ncbi:neurogenic locus notch homolog protein 1 [Plakobranchus ocellatus]|uniref:Neurogenic locus notch homolog protein 1 n=1 Tax=Plakobranchus ocellatus TaxID=259542 RepID=A0AAV4ARG5_9GAST|nr:neurogenic locus notch homolog protein 1 [Plakobranchus ocellatus]
MASRPSGASIALALILCCCLTGISGQGFAPTNVGGQADSRVPFHLHFVEMMFDDKGSDLMDKTTQAYKDVENAIEIALQGLGGYLSELSFENGLPCVRANVVWANLIEDQTHEVKERVDMSGIKLWNTAWKVSFEGCEAEMEAVVFNLYLPTLPWMEAMEDEKSSRYMSIKEEIESRFADLSGQLETLELTDNNGCLHVHVKWMAWFPAHIARLILDLKRTGLKLGDEVFIVETVPCMPSDAASRECPPVPPNTFGICIQDCDDNNPVMACDEGYKCCSNGCGNVCKKVNYKVMVTALIIIDEEFEESMTQGYAMEVAQVGVDSAVKNLFNTPTAAIVTSAKLRTFVEKDRWGRGYTMMVVDLYLSSDVPNDQLSSSLHAIEGTNLALGEANLRLLDVIFSNHSMMDMQSCGGSMCHGICKHLITGEDYCSCDEGFEGPACSAFDCRQDVSQFASDVQANYCEQGQCVKADEGDSYECDCNNGYHGTLCNVNVCDMMDNPCGGHGTCVGLVEQGLLCQCESGWGGIFCNTSADDGMSTCEMERRLMQFVHQQIFSPNVSPQLRVFMSTLLKRMDSDKYSVPYCWAKGSGRDGEYHSTCVYSSTTGEWDECYCLSNSREFNGYIYFGEGDCRVFTADDIRWGHDDFFILNMTWSQDLVTFDSELYMSIKDQVSKTAEYLGGGLTHLEFFRTEDDCVKAVAQWHLGSVAREGMLAEKLEGGGINVGVQNMKVSHQGCQDHGGDLHVVTYKFYVAGLPTPRDVTDHKGQVYRMAEAAVKQVFSGLGGKLRTLELAENNGCVMFFVEWEAAYPSKALSVLDDLKETGLATDDMKTYTVQSRPCLPSDSQLEGCPGVPQDVFGTCDEACNVTEPCEKPGYKCCSNGCGKACVRVGYKVKVSAAIVVDMAVHEDMKNSSSILYKSIEFGVDMMINEVYNLGPNRAIIGTEVTQILPMDYKSKTYPAIHVKIFLAEDFPNVMLLDSAYLLERSKLANLQNAPDFLMMKLLSHSMTDMTSCGGVECHGICKTLFSGDEYCSCEPGQRGAGCSVFDCRKDLDEYFPQDDFCHEGKCSLESESEGFQCVCNPGYYGDRCDGEYTMVVYTLF